MTLNNACEPARVDPAHPVTRIAVAALERAAGVAPILVPAGGSLPVLSGFAARGIPAVLTGFGTLDSRVHASDESIHAGVPPARPARGSRVAPRSGRVYWSGKPGTRGGEERMIVNARIPSSLIHEVPVRAA